MRKCIFNISLFWSMIQVLINHSSCRPNPGKLNGAVLENIVNDVLEEAGLRYINDILKTSASVSRAVLDGAKIVIDLVNNFHNLFGAKVEFLHRTRNATQQYGFQNTTRPRSCCEPLPSSFYNPLTGSTYDYQKHCYTYSPFLSPSSSGDLPSLEIVNVMVNNIKNEKELIPQYIGIEDGSFAEYPGFYYPGFCKTYDPRLRYWYVSAVNKRYKSAVFVVDTSSIAGNLIDEDTYISYVTSALLMILGTLAARDDAALVLYPNTIASNEDDLCFLDRLVQVSNDMSEKISAVLNKVSLTGATNYGAALQRGLDILRKDAANDKQHILFFFTAQAHLNDSISNWRNVFKLYFQDLQINWTDLPILLIYGLGKDDKLDIYLNVLKSVYIGEASYFHGNTKVELQKHVVTYYRNLPYNIEGRAYQSALFSTPDSSDLQTALSIPLFDHRGELLGVAGLEIDYKIILNSFLDYERGEKDSYAFIVDQHDGSAVYHPLHDYQTHLHLVSVKQLEDSPSAAPFIDRMLNDSSEVGETQAVVRSPPLDDFRILSSAGTQTVARKVNVTLFYGNVRVPGIGIRWAVCCVLVAGSQKVTLLPVQSAKSKEVNFFYHRADLQNLSVFPSSSYCYSAQGSTLKDQVFTIVSLPGFLDPFSRQINEDSQADVMQYKDIIQGLGSNTVFQTEILAELALLSDMDILWTRGPFSYDLFPYSTLRKVGAQFGTLKMYPGPTSIAAYNHLSEEWYTHALGRKDGITLTAPYHEVYDQEHFVVSLAKPVFHYNTTEIFAVLAADLSLEYINHLLQTSMWEDCASTDYYCFLLETDGQLLFHQKWLIFPYTDGDSITERYVIEEEPRISAHMLRNKYMVKTSCQIRFLDLEEYYYYVNLASVDHLHELGAQYKAEAVPGTNFFIFQTLRNAVESPNKECFCTQGAHAMCLLDGAGCECPCYTNRVFDTCSTLTNRTDWTPCANDHRATAFAKISDWKLNESPQYPCTGVFCPTTEFRQSCERIALCQWCTRNKAGADEQFCSPSSSCPGGISLSEIQDEELSTTERLIISGLCAGAALFVIIGIVVWCKKRKRPKTADSFFSFTSDDLAPELKHAPAPVQHFDVRSHSSKTASKGSKPRKKHKGRFNRFGKWFRRKRKKTAEADQKVSSHESSVVESEYEIVPVYTYDVDAFLAEYNQSPWRLHSEFESDSTVSHDSITGPDSESSDNITEDNELDQVEARTNYSSDEGSYGSESIYSTSDTETTVETLDDLDINSRHSDDNSAEKSIAEENDLSEKDNETAERIDDEDNGSRLTKDNASEKNVNTENDADTSDLHIIPDFEDSAVETYVETENERGNAQLEDNHGGSVEKLEDTESNLLQTENNAVETEFGSENDKERSELHDINADRKSVSNN